MSYLFDMRQVEKAGFFFNAVFFDPRALVEKVVENLASKAKEQKVEIKCRFEHGTPAVGGGDPTRLRMFLSFLLEHLLGVFDMAEIDLHLSSEGQTDCDTVLLVRVQPHPKTGRNNPYHSSGRSAPPVPPSQMHPTDLAFFLRFMDTADSSRGGDRLLDSAPVFRFEFLIRKQPACASDFCRRRILVAEDQQINQKVVLTFLSKMGYGADIRENGQEVIEALREKPYDLILMDWHMPVMDGCEATRRIRSNMDGILNPDIPIIALTANTLAGAREKCIQAGMNDYLPKPLQMKLLGDTISKWLR